ncbi:MAG: GH3 auxin-responsive promoter family protein [Bacteroidetes bacterium]|nr:GH3 auxin-responsive promoter family protein [Bacteroidota bacterium]
MLAPVISWYFRQRYEELQAQNAAAHRTQEHLFEYLLEHGAETVYGQKLGFRDIRSYEQWKQRVPVVEYEDLKPWIERTMADEQGLLWPGEITWFARSSGTTGNTAKFIPISYESLEHTHFQGSRDILTIYCAQYPDTRIFQGKGLLIGGSHKVNQLNTRSYYGDLSAVLMNHMPLWANLKSTPDISIALMDNWEDKLESMARSTLNENVTSISGVPTWTLVLFKRLLEISGKSNMHEVWPNLELFIHGGVSFTPYRQQFQELVPWSGMHYIETYNASEGFFGIQAEKDKADLLLMSDHGVFYEFYPVSKGPDHAVPLREVEPGINYAMVITTNSGLWRYKIGDTVQFSSVSPYTFRITGRTKLFINAFGEELVIENADAAIAAACAETGAIVADYTAAPVYMTESEPGHEWLIEFSQSPADLGDFTHRLDTHLQQNNNDYAAKRYMDLAMRLPHVKPMPRGTFSAWLKQSGKLGGQHKVPRLCNDRQVLESILRLLQPERAGE